MAKKVYIATPVNARKEATLEEKRQAAYNRVQAIKEKLQEQMPDAEFHSSFDEDIAPLNIELTKRMYGVTLPSEAVIIGRCVQRVMECDMVVFDYGWRESRGCQVENKVAIVYEKEISAVWAFDIDMEK